MHCLQKKIGISMMVILLLFTQCISISAKSLGWTMDTTLLKEDIAEYIQSFQIIPEREGYELYVNSYDCGFFTDTKWTYRWTATDYVTIDITVDIEKQMVHFQKKQSQLELISSLFVFEISKEGSQIATFYIDKNKMSNPIIRKGTKKNDIYDFGEFSFVWNEQSIMLRVWIDDTKSIAYVQKNGESSVVSYPLEKENAVRKLYYENLVPAQLLRMEYLEKGLEKVDFDTASQYEPIYSDSQVDRAVSNEKITLINSTTSKTYQVDLRQSITFWQRIKGGEAGTGEYGNTLSTIQVVCQWGEAACEEVRKKYGISGRLYAVFGDKIAYHGVNKIYGERETEHRVYEYQNAYWGTNWTQNDIYASIPKKDFTWIQYRQRIATASSWSEYRHTTEEKDECEEDSLCEWESKILWRKNIGTWTSWSAYSATTYPSDCNESADCEWRGKEYYSEKVGTWGLWSTKEYSSSDDTYIDCEDSSNCKLKFSSTIKQYQKRTASAKYETCSGKNCQYWTTSGTSSKSNPYRTAYKYTCKGLFLSYKRYSTENYSKNEKGPCDNNHIISEIELGKQKGTWQTYSSWSGNISGTMPPDSVSSTTKIDYRDTSVKMYKVSYLSWSGWSVYSQEPCTASETKKCQKRVFYSTKKRTWSGWSEYKYDACSESDNVKCGSAKRYSFQYLSWGAWSSWQDTSTQQQNSTTKAITYRYQQPIFKWEKEKGTSTQIGHNGLYSNESKSHLETSMVTDYWAEDSWESVGSKKEMTEEMVHQVTSNIYSSMLQSYSMEKLKEEQNTTSVLYSDVIANVKKISSSEQTTILQKAKGFFEEQPIFIPYLYITKHWRAVEHDTDVSGYDHQQAVVDSSYAKTVISEDQQPLVQQVLRQPSKVIYFDYHDPLERYGENVPDNWKGYESLVEQIKNTNLSNYKVQVVLTKDDLEAMKKYAQTNGGSCEFIQRFRYVFLMNDEMWNRVMGECEIEWVD